MAKFRIMQSDNKYWKFYVQKKSWLGFWYTVKATDYRNVADSHIENLEKGVDTSWRKVYETGD